MMINKRMGEGIVGVDISLSNMELTVLKSKAEELIEELEKVRKQGLKFHRFDEEFQEECMALLKWLHNAVYSGESLNDAMVSLGFKSEPVEAFPKPPTKGVVDKWMETKQQEGS